MWPAAWSSEEEPKPSLNIAYPTDQCRQISFHKAVGRWPSGGTLSSPTRSILWLLNIKLGVGQKKKSTQNDENSHWNYFNKRKMAIKLDESLSCSSLDRSHWANQPLGRIAWKKMSVLLHTLQNLPSRSLRRLAGVDDLDNMLDDTSVWFRLIGSAPASSEDKGIKYTSREGRSSDNDCHTLDWIHTMRLEWRRKKKKKKESEKNLSNTASKKKTDKTTKQDTWWMSRYFAAVILQKNICPAAPVGTSCFHSPHQDGSLQLQPQCSALSAGIQRCTIKPCWHLDSHHSSHIHNIQGFVLHKK